MKIDAIVASRMTSTRLPGKILKDLAGKPALAQLVDRLRQSRFIQEVIIATTTNDTDDRVETLSKELATPFFRGSEEDVLLRTLGAAEENGTDLIVLITSDCPLMDAQTVDTVIERMLEHPYLDFATNQMFLTYPLGFGVEVFRTNTLKEVEGITNDPADREHVSLYIYERPERFHLSNVEAPAFLRHPEYRLTLDTPQDYELIRTIYNNLFPDQPAFDLYDIVRYLARNPQLLQINNQVKQKSAR